MENLTWDAVPTQRKRRTEKYDYAVVTMSALTKPGAGRKFSFNKAAQEMLNIEGEDRISFGFNNDRTIIAIRKSDGDNGFKLTKTCTFSDKRTFEFISKILGLDNSTENEFKIQGDDKFYTLELIMNINDLVADAEAEDMKTEKVIEEKTAEDELEVTESEDVNNQW